MRNPPLIDIHNIDAWEYISLLPDKCVNAIITDPMYDSSIDMNELLRICSGHIVMFSAPENPFFSPDERAYWIKPPSTKNNAGSKKLSRFVEVILIKRRGDTFNTGLHWSNYTGVYDDRLLTKQIHPFEKPISLLERLIAIYTRPGDRVFDPFFGSGSTLKAAYNLGRDSLGCESNPEYYKTFKESL